ncbi:uncharacterized protein LOC130448598 isoform X1 [Diorhabda sublineata]|uniref:uncharacterized protein LOC130448598 isoform X1 n=1 Tax=Diorhabda sublineata TaxID=1163346 RepID=UPI0024E08B71|nr:uncharacterized protein LOC130448598 isoform X1 [Diorhabda sublineata]
MWKIYIFVVLPYVLHKCVVVGNVNRTGYFNLEVSVGQTLVIACKSSDLNHTFEYWILDNNVIIGPSNQNFDNDTFILDAISGNLTIKSISKELDGIYACVSKNIIGNERRVERTRIIVEQDWEEVYEHDSNINLIRVLIIAATLVIVGIGGYIVFRMWRERYYYPSYLGHEDEGGSREEIYRSPTTSGIGRSRSPRRIVLERSTSHPIDNDTITTDFKSILERANS